MELKETVEFKDLGLSEAVLRAIADAGYKHPTPIQEQTIPITLMCRDVLGLAQTGTGKTGAFTIPMIDILSGGRAKARMPRSLILSPTRELAAQISENFVKYGKHHPLTQALIVGGTSMDEQIRNLDRGVDVLIATPGRLLDLFQRGKILLADIKILVIDEADRMLDMGFIPDLEKIVSILPPLRQTLFFSATMPPEIKKLADKFLSNPKVVSVSAPSSVADNVEHFIVNVPHFRDKQSTFYKIFQQEDVKNAFVFCNRKRDINDVCRFMKSKGIKAAGLHGDMEQDQRTDALNTFKSGLTQVLVCSDVAARGLDVQGMSHVFNWDVPHNPEDYVHRTGRTGRAGAQGRAFTFSTPNDFKSVGLIEKLIGKKINVFSPGGKAPAAAASEAAPPPRHKPRHEPKHPSPSKRHPPREQKRSRHEEHHNILSEENNGRFGEDAPSFLKGK
ncbi:MAG: DEAD/DEAH box helicase [Proteobacteria bacterium]|nr:DEAD/DEAH box helicase [Pseudomonadota bacterium]